MRYSDGYWLLKLAPTDNNIQITYQMHGDADATLPSELTQLGIVNSAFVTLTNLKSILPRQVGSLLLYLYTVVSNSY